MMMRSTEQTVIPVTRVFVLVRPVDIRAESDESTKQEAARSRYHLPVDRKIALALGFATHTKGWDILKEMKMPDNWIILVNHSRNYYSKERDLINPLDVPSNHKNKWVITKMITILPWLHT